MNTEQQKIGKILEELINYFFRNKSYDLKIDLNYQEDKLCIKVVGECQEKPNDYQELYDLLNSTTRPELEEYYYELLGSNELKLLGSLIDCAEMSYLDKQLCIKVYRDIDDKR
jgi:hypothetical protein